MNNPRFMAVLAFFFSAVALSSAPTSPAWAQEALDDADIKSAITADFLVDEAIPSHLIDVSVDNGVVTLDGSVYNILARDRAIAVAQSIKGVRSVVPMMIVTPIARSDGEISKDVTNALLVDPATDSYEVEVAVEKGTVTLTGEVESFAEQQLCTEVAKGVRGVKAVENRIDITQATDRPDLELEAEIDRMLESDVRVNARNIAVDVQDGEVSLTGSVGSARERSRATTIAWVAGVEAVENDLAVHWWDAGDDPQRSAYVHRSDEEIERSVKDAFLYDPRVQSFDVSVDSELGTVTLNGVVNNLAAKMAAEKDARNTVGVWSVINNIDVRPSRRVDDAEIIGRVEAALDLDPYLDRHDIIVSSYNGKVYLHGTVDTEFEKEWAESAAWGVNGVVQVQNALDVHETVAWKSDWEILRDIRSQLYWSPFVDSEDIVVEVENGEATLTGTVDTWLEYTEAAENAREGGAVTIDNDLAVVYGPEFYAP